MELSALYVVMSLSKCYIIHCKADQSIFTRLSEYIDHQKLFEVLENCVGITGNALQWIKSYLSNRKQSVTIKGTSSEKRDLEFGVPQCSVLGPILFTIYTLPLADIIRNHCVNYHLYADDTQLYLTFKTPSNVGSCASSPDSLSTAKSRMESCINDIRSWMRNNFLKLNEEKTEVVIINAPRRSNANLTSIQVGPEEVQISASARNIGVLFDSSLSHHDHISNITRKCFYHLHKLWKIRKYLSKESSETLVHSLISNNLDYCNSLLAGLPTKELDRLQAVQNAAARLVVKTSKYEHITPILFELHWLPVASRVKFKFLLLTYKSLNGLAPHYLSELLEINTTGPNTRSKTQTCLNVPKTKMSTYGDRSFSFQAPMLWNCLPDEIRRAPNVNLFKNKLKTHLFKGSIWYIMLVYIYI